MADYYPLLARALDGLADPGPEARAAVFDRARDALHAQLKSINPPLTEAEIGRERASLDEAIDRIERVHASERATAREEQPASENPPANPDDAAGSDGAIRRPRVEKSPSIRRGGRRGRSLLTAAGLLAVIAPIAVAAWLWRDQPQTASAPEPPRPAAPQPAANDPKFPERMAGQGAGSPLPRPPDAPPPVVTPPSREAGPAGAPAPAEPSAPSTARPSEPPAPASPAPGAQPDVAVAQRAALVEENTADPQQPKMTSGRALWRLDTINSGQGQLLETVVRATVDIPDAKLSLSLLLRRNRDPALPASHTLELNFTTAATGEDARVVRDVNPPLIRLDDSARGVPLAALSVPVKENVFLIGLSNLRSDIERNTDLLVNRNWIELPLRFGSGARATLVFEKGVTGDRVVADAFKQWAQP